MAALCICGVCIPYTALIPFILVALREIWYFFFGKPSKTAEEKNCCQSEETVDSQSFQGGHLGYLTKDQDWNQVIGGNQPAFVKFTATWCKPCKEIDPFFRGLSEKHSAKATFINVDVDEFDELASEHGALSIPHFVCFKNSERIDAISGNNEEKLENFVHRYL